MRNPPPHLCTATRRTWTLGLGCFLGLQLMLSCQIAQRSLDLSAGPQDPPSPVPEVVYELERTVITATRTPRKILDAPRSVSLIDRERLDELQPLVPLDALRYEPGIFLEKRTTTTSDPILRGFAGRNILTLVDGNTLTTLWGEGGDGADDMYGKIDPDWVDRIEVVRGPASVLYGSNAIGGVINFLTRKPAVDYTLEGADFRFRTKGTYGSAAQERHVRTEVHGAFPQFRFLLGGSRHELEDVEGGRGLGTLDPTDSEATNWDLTVDTIPFGPEHAFALTYQETHQDHTKRFYRPEQDNFNDRDALGLSYVNTDNDSFWDRLEARVYSQNKQDRRRWLSGEDAGQRGVARTRTLSADLQLTSPLGSNHRLTYGLHWERDDGESPDDEQFTITRPGEAKVKPAPDSIWQDHGVFVQDEWEALDRLTVIASARYDAFTFRTDVDQFYRPPLEGQDPELDEISEHRGVFSGGLGLVCRLTERSNLFLDYSRGYRLNAPNFGVRLLSDLGYLAPNPFLDPIIADQFEAGVKVAGGGYQGELAAYTTAIDNQQSITQGSFDGRDFFDENDNGVRDEGELDILETVAGGKATLVGIDLSGEATLATLAEWLGHPGAIGPEWSVRGGFSWETGKDRQIDQPIRWVHPAFGVAALRYENFEVAHPFWMELAGTFVRRFDRVVAGREGDPAWRDDPQDRDSGLHRSYAGVPGYSILDLRGGIRFGERDRLTVAIENLTDKRYRSAHSRIPAPGINFLVSLDLWF